MLYHHFHYLTLLLVCLDNVSKVISEQSANLLSSKMIILGII